MIKSSDESWADFKKKQAQCKRTTDADKKDAGDLKKAENDQKARVRREKADAEKSWLAAASVTAGGTVVGKGGKDAVTKKDKDDAIKTNLDSQSKLQNNTGRCVMVAIGRFAGNAWTNTSLDADTAVNEVNKDNESDYFYLVINGLLKPLDLMASDGTVWKCISVARYYINIVRSSVSPDSVTSPVTDGNEIVPDSGATSDMRKYI